MPKAKDLSCVNFYFHNLSPMSTIFIILMQYQRNLDCISRLAVSWSPLNLTTPQVESQEGVFEQHKTVKVDITPAVDPSKAGNDHLCHVSVTCHTHFSHVSVTCQIHFSHVSVTCQIHFSHLPDSFQSRVSLFHPRVRFISVMCQSCVILISV